MGHLTPSTDGELEHSAGINPANEFQCRMQEDERKAEWNGNEVHKEMIISPLVGLASPNHVSNRRSLFRSSARGR